MEEELLTSNTGAPFVQKEILKGKGSSCPKKGTYKEPDTIKVQKGC